MPSQPDLPRTRLAVDIGGTFTDLILQIGSVQHAAKLLTTHAQPADAVLAGVEQLLTTAAIPASNVDLVLHGTTLATNALIERRGAVTALLTTRGHRDVLEMAFENRFEQYDIGIDRPLPLVPRHLRIGVAERMAADGAVLLPLDEQQLLSETEALIDAGVESLAIGFLHAWRSPDHEQRAAALIARRWPELSISLSSDVCPEVREYERLSTTCANAYVKPLMASYLQDLAQRLLAFGIGAPLRLMTSGGGLTDLETAARYPIRLVESGPAGGAILAGTLARAHDAPLVLSFDMGGTTAKLCLLDDGEPVLSRAFEVDRAYRFKRGSGLPVRIPVVEMVEIGAGGGSIASTDRLGRVQVGPESAGSDPGPVAYGRGGVRATVTDADVHLGRVSVSGFTAAGLAVDAQAVAAALQAELAAPLAVAIDEAAHRLSEVVDENMAAASRAHAAEWGRPLDGRLLIAFGGAAPVHAARLAQKLGIRRVLIPAHAGVGSALGFLQAPVRYEVVRSRFEILTELDSDAVSALFAQMRGEATAIVRAANPDAEFAEVCRAYMRYQGQGYEIAVPVVGSGDLQANLAAAFAETYSGLYGRTIPDVEIEIMSWTLSLTEQLPPVEPLAGELATTTSMEFASTDVATVFDAATAQWLPVQTVPRSQLDQSNSVQGAALITEAHTTTYVPAGWSARCCEDGALVLETQS